MAKKKNTKSAAATAGHGAEIEAKEEARLRKESYLFNMSHSILPDKSVYGLQMVPAVLFTSIVILLVRMFRYKRDMSGYYWSTDRTELVEFFSHYKMYFIILSVILMLFFLLYRFVTQSLAIKRSVFYIPMGIYLLFVLLSYAFSEYRDVAWGGWNDRFEGTFVIICYMLMLFYIVNSVNTERNLKWMLYPVTGVTVILSALGISQATDHDFFRTLLGQKLIVPNEKYENGMSEWELIDRANESGQDYLVFEFQNKEIYQSVYNINYVSFYLTLLLPIFALLFIREKQIAKKGLWGLIFGLVVFNLIGSASSGGLLGSAVIVVVAVILLNKRILHWWKPVAVLVAITVVVGGITFDRWSSELTSAVGSVLGNNPGTVSSNAAAKDAEDSSSGADGASSDAGQEKAAGDSSGKAGASGHKIDYFITNDKGLTFSVDGNAATLAVSPAGTITVADSGGETIPFRQNSMDGQITFEDERLEDVVFTPAQDEEGADFLTFTLNGEAKKWNFKLTGEENGGLIFQNDLGKTVDLADVPHLGFKNNPGFGSGRGYIWSASLPMLKDTFFLGKGADTYVLYFPHKDYVGKYNAGWNVNNVVDKPHNMYIGIAFNTGFVSLIALLALFGIYLVQSFRLYRRDRFDSFASYAGAGIFLGICGFLVSGLVNDTSVSVMPMFYGLLGTGIAANIIVRRQGKVAG